MRQHLLPELFDELCNAWTFGGRRSRISKLFNRHFSSLPFLLFISTCALLVKSNSNKV
jgi:hypothetical protein